MGLSRRSLGRVQGQVFGFSLSDDIMDLESGDTTPIWHHEDWMQRLDWSRPLTATYR